VVRRRLINQKHQRILCCRDYRIPGYLFTDSTLFANPDVKLARSMTDTFTGIRPVDVLVCGGSVRRIYCGDSVVRMADPIASGEAKAVVVPHSEQKGKIRGR
jgi:hypothetical protein